MSALLASGPTEVWANLQRLYPVYSALVREFGIENAPCMEIEDPTQVPSAEAIASVEEWFAGTDEKIHIQHLRQFVQTSSQLNDRVLRDLLIHSVEKKKRTQHDRDKVDFLLVQFLAEHAPIQFSEADMNIESAARLLEPLFGTIEIKGPELLQELNDLLDEARDYKTLNSLFTARIIERGRQIKERCGEKFFEPQTMLAFARFGLLMRQRFFRLMHRDMNAILDGLRDLEARGLTTIDCRRAQFSSEEPISRLRMICQSWKVMFHAEYSAGQPLCILVDLRTAVETAIKESPGQAKARAAAAGGFEISADANPDTNATGTETE